MANNKRINWGVHCAGIKPVGETGNYEEVHGLQEFGRTITIDNTPIFEIGQFAIYELLEGIPDVSVTMDRVLDGYPILWHLSTQGYTNNTLFGRLNQQCIIGSAVYPDTNDSASGTPLSMIEMSGFYASDWSVTLDSESEFRESLTLVGNEFRYTPAGVYGSFATTVFDNNDSPLSLPLSGGVQQRENFILGPTASSSRLPRQIPGVSSSGTINPMSNGEYPVHIKSITVSASIAREAENELGRKAPYYRSPTLPIEVTCDITFNSLSGEVMNFTEAGYLGNGSNLQDEAIRIVCEEGLTVDLGSKCKLNSISTTDGSAGGGNMQHTFSYTTYNVLTITHPMDPGA